MATAMPKPTPRVLMSRPRPASRALAESDFVAKEILRRHFDICVKTDVIIAERSDRASGS
jgi:hypothetical protein